MEPNQNKLNEKLPVNFQAGEGQFLSPDEMKTPAWIPPIPKRNANAIHTLEEDRQNAIPRVKEIPYVPHAPDTEEPKMISEMPGFKVMPKMPNSEYQPLKTENHAPINLEKTNAETIVEKIPEALEKISTVHTYTDDAGKVIKREHESLATIAMAESKRAFERSGENTPETGRFKTKIILAVASSILFLGGLAIISYYLFDNKEPAEITRPYIAEIIKVDAQRLLEVSEYESFLYKYSNELRRSIPNGQSVIEFIMPKMEATDSKTLSRPITLFEFLSFIKAEAPAELNRVFDPKFFFGMHIGAENEPVIIVKVNSYDLAYAGMLRWEQTLEDDMADLFGYKKGIVELKERIFQDGIVKNKDTRYINDSQGNIKMLYSFTDINTLVITRNERTLREINERFLASKLVR